MRHTLRAPRPVRRPSGAGQSSARGAVGEMSPSVENRWRQLCSVVRLDHQLSDKWWTRISDSLSAAGGVGGVGGGKQRKYYYNLEYLHRRFVMFDRFADQMTDPTSVAVAMFLQHLHYDPHLHGVCEQSTLTTLEELAADLPADAGAEALMGRVRLLLTAAMANSTPVHLDAGGAYGCDDEHFFLDLETSVMGACPADYADYAARMRDEYGFMTQAGYTQLRLKVLRYFLMVPNIFATRPFRDQFEAQARQNISREIESIAGSSTGQNTT